MMISFRRLTGARGGIVDGGTVVLLMTGGCGVLADDIGKPRGSFWFATHTAPLHTHSPYETGY
jgi:hypothetical protein